MTIPKMNLSLDEALDFINISIGLFNPVTEYMNEEDFHCVAKSGNMKNGEIFTIPMTFDLNLSPKDLGNSKRVEVFYKDEKLGFLEIDSIFEVKKEDYYPVFNTDDQENHPGLKKVLGNSLRKASGKPKLTNDQIVKQLNILTPTESRKEFEKKGWKTIVGFQTRNPIHRAHEYLQRVALEVADGLFINPLIGWKKKGDFTEEAILAAYTTMTEKFYPSSNVFFKGLRTSMKYAGPREAVHHAIIRRNLGCTHFIIGRDHAGVADFYELYDAHKYARSKLETGKLGIDLLLLKGPCFCTECDLMVSENSCSHSGNSLKSISGTYIRSLLNQNKVPPSYIMRKEVFESIINTKKIFID